MIASQLQPPVVEQLNAVQRELEPRLEKLASSQADKIANRLSGCDSLAIGSYGAMEDVCRSELLDHLLSAPTLDEIAQEMNAEEDDLHLAASRTRQLARPLKITFPEIELEVPLQNVVLAVVLGTLLGLWVLAPWLALVLGSREAGVVLGLPLGSIGAVLGVMVLARHQFVLKWLKGLLPVAATGMAIYDIFVARHPARLIWRFVTSQSPVSASRLPKWLVFGLCWALVKLAEPIHKDIRERTYQAVKCSALGWLRHHLDLLVLLTTLTKSNAGHGPGINAADLPLELVRALDDLAVAMGSNWPETEDPVLRHARQTVQWYTHAGFEPHTPDPVFQHPMSDLYDVLGLVHEGDPIEVDLRAVLRSGQVVLRGRLMRKWDGDQ